MIKAMPSASLRPFRIALAALALVAAALGCKKSAPLPTGSPTPAAFFISRLTDTRFNTADHFLASIEMQISGEPFAQTLGRDLAQFARSSAIPDYYYDAAAQTTVVDPLGF